MMRSRAALGLYLGLVFISGAVLGVMGDRYYTASTQVRGKGKGRPSPEEFRRGYLEFMQKRLSLTEQQTQELGQILDDTRAKVDAAVRATVPQQQAIRQEQNGRIRGMLNEKQISEYETMLKERDERNKNKRKNDRGPGGF